MVPFNNQQEEPVVLRTCMVIPKLCCTWWISACGVEFLDTELWSHYYRNKLLIYNVITVF